MTRLETYDYVLKNNDIPFECEMCGFLNIHENEYDLFHYCALLKTGIYTGPKCSVEDFLRYVFEEY